MINMLKVRRFLIFWSFLCFFSLSEAATLTLPPDVTVSIPSFVRPRDIAVGSILRGASESSFNVEFSNGDCEFLQKTEVFGVPVPGRPNAYQTNIPGVGMQFGVTEGWNGGYVLAPHSITSRRTTTPLSVRHYRKAELVAIGQLQSGTVTEAPYMIVTYSGSCFPTVSYRVDVSLGQTVVTPHTCSVLSSNVNVKLPDVPAADLRVVNSTQGDTPFSIDMECTTGSKVYVTLSDKNDLSNRSGVLSLDPTSTAAGVGIEVSMKEQIVRFGPDSAVAKNQNQMLVGDSSLSLSTIPFTARYISKGNVKAGTVKATATFTMSYQ